LDYPNFEVMVLPDEDVGAELIPGAECVPTGSMGPSEKRDLAAERATGEILAFIDDDAFPVPDWLSHAIPLFEDDNVGAVGGPAVTPPSDSLLLQASGAVYGSLLGGGPHSYRYIPGKPREVDDYPSCNLLVRKSTFDEVGGFDSEYYPGEDTKLCLSITKDLGKLILYEPRALVYHHRRNIFRGHVKQVANYAKHRGYFVKKFPETSLRLNYFLPSMLVIGLIVGFPFLWFSGLRELYLGMVGLYLLLALTSSIQAVGRHPSLLALTFVGTVLTQLTYGVWFLRGLALTGLKR
jgi:cellulose synthase/poly-beta-1,6-N-acetylglucosamine synthase-like glycosyltransferase